MTFSTGRLLLWTLVVWACSVGVGRAGQANVSGDWQANLDCNLTATASLLLHLDEDSASGAVTGNMTDCGTFEVPGAIRRPSSCVLTPSVLQGHVTGTDMELPSGGNYMSDATVPAFPFLNCTAATEILSSHHLSGTVQVDDAGNAVGINGTWMNGAVDFRDSVGASCWSLSSTPSCSLDMRRNDLAVGTNVTVSPRHGSSVTFDNITSPGIAWVMPLTDADASVPAEFEVMGNDNVSIFYDVHTTAAFTGTVKTCFSYPDSDGDGLVDGTQPPLDETALRVLHAENGTFVDRTTSLDTTAKIICGATQSLSQLAVAHPPGTAESDTFFQRLNMTLRRRRSGKETAQLKSFFYGGIGADPAWDPRLVGATVEVFSKAESTVARFDMPAAGWKATRDGKADTAYRFTNPSAPNEVSSIARAVWTPNTPGRSYGGEFQFVGRSAGLALSAPQEAVDVRLTVGSRRWCLTFFLPTKKYPASIDPSIDRRNLLHISGWGSAPRTLDCADKRMQWALHYFD
jgi:hypothetical protein